MELRRLTYFNFNIGCRARNAGRFIGRVRNELLRALSEKKAESGFCQEALARKLDLERSLINRQFSGEENLSLRSIADLAWAMGMEISFELKSPAANAGQNQPMMTSTVSHGEIKYIDGSAKEALGSVATASSGFVMAKTA
jgi:hypothetical protein